MVKNFVTLKPTLKPQLRCWMTKMCEGDSELQTISPRQGALSHRQIQVDVFLNIIYQITSQSHFSTNKYKLNLLLKLIEFYQQGEALYLHNAHETR